MNHNIVLPPGWKVSDVIQETQKKEKMTDEAPFQEGDTVQVLDTARSKTIRGATGPVLEVKRDSVQVLINGEKRWLSPKNLQKIK